MTAWAYYNEWDEPTAAWLRELIARGLVAPGEVDTRSIAEVSPDDLRGFTQAHFFAGIGGWSHALRLARWPDDRPVWTGSPPCQPFSMAGKRDGYADARHLAPKWLDLVKVCAPERLFGEQVSDAISKGWLDALQHELEAENYACGAVTLASCGVGAPNIRHRLYFAAERLGDGDGEGSQGRSGSQGGPDQQPARARGVADGLADARGVERQRRAGEFGPACESPPERHEKGADAERSRSTSGLANCAPVGRREEREDGGRLGARDGAQGRAAGLDAGGDAGGLADADCEGRGWRGVCRPRKGAGAREGATLERFTGLCQDQRPGPTNGFWRDADWLFCRDGKWRPVEPGVEPLADGVFARVVKLRGYGNAINPIVAAAFIEAVDDALGNHQKP